MMAATAPRLTAAAVTLDDFTVSTTCCFFAGWVLYVFGSIHVTDISNGV